MVSALTLQGVLLTSKPQINFAKKLAIYVSLMELNVKKLNHAMRKLFKLSVSQISIFQELKNVNGKIMPVESKSVQMQILL